MQYRETTQVPNIVFDRYLPSMTLAETRLVLIIIRQTYGWVDQRTGERKTRDRISHGQLVAKSKISRRAISNDIKRLIDRRLAGWSMTLRERYLHKGRSQGLSDLAYCFSSSLIFLLQLKIALQVPPRAIHSFVIFLPSFFLHSGRKHRLALAAARNRNSCPINPMNK